MPIVFQLLSGTRGRRSTTVQVKYGTRNGEHASGMERKRDVGMVCSVVTTTGDIYLKFQQTCLITAPETNLL